MQRELDKLGEVGGGPASAAPMRERVRHLADLARLRLDDAEAAGLARDLEALLQLVDRLPAPAPEDSTAAGERGPVEAPVLPEAGDAVEPGLPLPVFLANAPSTDGDLLSVPAVRPPEARRRRVQETETIDPDPSTGTAGGAEGGSATEDAG